MHTQRGRFAEDFSGGLRSGQTEDEGDGVQWRRDGFPGKAEIQVVGVDDHNEALAAGTVNQSRIKTVANLALQDFEEMHGPHIGPWQRLAGFLGSE